MKSLLPWMAVVAVAVGSGCQSPMFATKSDAKSHEPLVASDTARDGGLLGLAGTADDLLAAGPPSEQQPSTSRSAASASPASPTEMVARRIEQGDAALADGDLDEAKRHYEAVLQLQPRDPDAHHRLAVIADKQQEYRIAENHYLTALRAKPRNADLLSDLGYSYRLQGRLHESERYLKQAIEIEPTHRHALSNLGVLYATEGDYDAALAMFLRAGDEADAYANMAKLFPEGRPSAENAGPEESSFADEFYALAAADAAESRTPQAEMNAPTRQLKEMMEQARREEIAARNAGDVAPEWARQADHQASGPHRPTMAAAPQRSFRDGADRVPMDARPPMWPARNGFNPPQGDVPDSRLNDVLAGIENGRPSYGASSRMPSESFGSNSRTLAALSSERKPQITPRFPDENERSATDSLPSITPAAESPQLAKTDPLDSMEAWPPVATGDDSRQIELASGSVEPWPYSANTTRQHETVGLGTDVPSGATGAAPASWPQNSRQTGVGAPARRSPIQPVDYAAAGSDQRQQSTTGAPNDAVRQAALLGMSAGPGQMFPMTAPGMSGAAPAPSTLPGSGSRVNGSQYAPPPRYNRSLPYPESQSGRNANHFESGGQSESNPTGSGYATGSSPQASGMNDGGTTARYMMFSSDGSAPVAYDGPEAPRSTRGRDPLSEYAAQARRHNEEFGNVSRQLHAERQSMSPTPPRWPSRMSESTQPWPQNQAWDHRNPRSGIVPSRHEVPATPAPALESSGSFVPDGYGSQPSSTGFDSSRDPYQGAVITPR